MAWAIFSMLFLAIGGVVYGAAALIWFALTILANWLMFMKAGEAGWKSIIPVYNTYTAYKIAWTPNMFWIYFIFTVLESIFSSISGGDFWSFSEAFRQIHTIKHRQNDRYQSAQTSQKSRKRPEILKCLVFYK